MKCSRCGQQNQPGQRFCSQCGAQLGADANSSPQFDLTKSTNSLVASLQKLGIPLSARQLAGLGLAILVGLIVARVMPYIYPILFSSVLDVVFGSGPSQLRDGFNTFLMTLCTLSASFIVSFFTVFLTRRRR